jgi:hypothetical protein
LPLKLDIVIIWVLLTGATKMPTFTVTLTAQCVVVIDAESDDQAGMLAMSETPLSAFSIESGDQIHEIPPEEIERYKRNADYVVAN